VPLAESFIRAGCVLRYSSTVKIATWNVNGIRARAAEVLAFLEREQPDALCLQEIKADPEKVPEPLRSLPGYECCWHGHKGYSGVALLLRRETLPGPVFAHPPFDHETRVVTARLGDLLLASIYVPNGGRDLGVKIRFLEALSAFAAAERAKGTRLVLCGDLNVALEERDVHPSLRNADQVGQTPHERALLAELIAQGLVDLGRRFRPDDDQLFSWWAPWRNMKARNIGWRLDYVLASEAIAATACESQRETGTSDHGPVVALLELAPQRLDRVPEPPAAAAASKGQLAFF
jgi:exodeoxyribonuclease-3